MIYLYVPPQFAESPPVSQLEIAQLAACLLAKPNPRMNVLDLNEGVANDAASCIIDNSAGSSQTTAFKSNAGHHAGAPELRRYNKEHFWLICIGRDAHAQQKTTCHISGQGELSLESQSRVTRVDAPLTVGRPAQPAHPPRAV